MLKVIKTVVGIATLLSAMQVWAGAENTPNAGSMNNANTSSAGEDSMKGATATTKVNADTSDAAILNTITHRMNNDSELSNLNIAVNVKDGIVSLAGNLNTEAEGGKIVQIAQSVPGVRDVETVDLKVQNSTQAIADTWITAKIKGVYLRDKLFTDEDVAAMTIKVVTDHGFVTLSGTANNQTQIDNAASLARSVKGVTEVKSEITLKKPN